MEKQTTTSDKPVVAATTTTTTTTKSKQTIHYPFWFGGSASSMAATVTHPLDLGKSWSSLEYVIRFTSTKIPKKNHHH